MPGFNMVSGDSTQILMCVRQIYHWLSTPSSISDTLCTCVVFVCIGVHVCTGVCLHAHEHMQARGWCQVLFSIPLHHTSEIEPLPGPEIPDSATQADHLVPGSTICLPPSTRIICAYHHAWHFSMGSDNPTLVLLLVQQHFAARATAQLLASGSEDGLAGVVMMTRELREGFFKKNWRDVLL